MLGLLEMRGQNVQQQGCSESSERFIRHHPAPQTESSVDSPVERLSARLRDVEEVYRESEEELTATRTGPVERVSGTQSVGIRLDERMLALRSQIADFLCSWAGLVIAERGLPSVPGTEVPALLRFLGEQAGWLASHPAARDLDAELTALLDSARSLLGPRAYEVSLGTCCHHGCTARLRATLRGTSDTVYSRVACDAGHTVPPRDWLLLSGRARPATEDGPANGPA